MKAIGLEQFGGPEVLHPVELPEAHAGNGEVRIRVRAAAVNPADAMLRDGSLASWYADATPPFIPGMDVAGVVDEVGADVDPVSGLVVGAEVVAVIDNAGQRGGYSELLAVPAASVAVKPAKLSFPQAASFLMNALTARNALELLGDPYGTLLVTGAAGAVGGFTLRLAKDRGWRTFAGSAAADERLVRSFGADAVIDRGERLVDRIRALAPEGVGAAVNGADLGAAVVGAVRAEGTIVSLRGWQGPKPQRGINVVGANVRERVEDTAAIRDLVGLVAAGVLPTRVALELPAEQAADAHRRLEQGGLRGRIILTF